MQGYNLKNHPFRIQQDSNISVIKKFYKLSKVIKEHLVKINTDKSMIEATYQKHVELGDKQDQREKALLGLYNLSKDTFKQVLQENIKLSVAKLEIDSARQEADLLGQDFGTFFQSSE